MARIRHYLAPVSWCLLALVLLLATAGCGGGGSSSPSLAVTLTAMPAIIRPGEQALLQWSSTAASSVASSTFGATGVSGSVSVTPDETTTYGITVTDGQRYASASATVTLLSIPPAPQQSAFPVNTANYYYLYTSTTMPFPPDFQFPDAAYPLPVAYTVSATPPPGFDLRTHCEDAIRMWATADPRTTIVSGVLPAQALVQVRLVTYIDNDPNTNRVGLATAYLNGGLRMDVQVATKYKTLTLTAAEVDKILSHELGHVLGLGHTDDTRDLMHYRDNLDQGNSFNSFLTYGDAMAVWTTLTQKLINWYPERVPVTPATAGIARFGGSGRAWETTGGHVVCVYEYH